MRTTCEQRLPLVGAAQAADLSAVCSCCAMLGIGLSLLIVPIGCDNSPPVYPVSGQVLIDGKPATKGSISFVPENGRPATSQIDSSGRFRLTSHVVAGQQEGVLPGVYRVAVTSNEIVDDETARWLAPSKYADFRTSGLKVNVAGPLDEVKIELTWDGVEDSPQEAADSDPPTKKNVVDAPVLKLKTTATEVN